MSNNPFLPNVGAGAPMPAPSGAPSNDAFEIDLTGVESNNGFTIPDGLYKIKCIDVSQDVSKGGNPMFVWDFEVSEGDHKGFLTKVFTAITPAAMWKVAETVQALGVGQSGEVVKFKRTDVVGKECGAQIEATEYNGTTRSQISKVMSLKELMEAKG
jgi:hypothetical protein